MAYEGKTLVIRFGSGGLHSDDVHSIIPPHKLISMRNISVEEGRLQKERGSRRWNSVAMPVGIKRAIDWFPNENNQRVIAILADGTVRRFKTAFSNSEVTHVSPAPAKLLVKNFTQMIIGGEEEPGRDRKCFILTGNDPIQVIEADGTTRRNITKPAADWTDRNQPFFSIKHRERMFTFGNRNAPHRIYVAAAIDDEDYTTNPLTFNINPGESERIITGRVYKGRLFVAKFPEGFYVLDDSNLTDTNWRFVKLQHSFGAASPHSTAEALDDVILANNYGSLSSIKAADTLGDVKTADIFSQMRVEKFIRNEISKAGLTEREMIYYPDKRTIFVTYRSAGGIKNDRICKIAFGRPEPIISWSDKDQPNSFFLRKDVNGVQRPFYCADDGYLYEMDVPDFNVGGNAYRGEFITPYIDIGVYDLMEQEQNKNFDFLEVIFEPTGNFSFFVDVFIDGVFSETLEFNLSDGTPLDQIQLDVDRLNSDMPQSERQPMGGTGRRVSLRCYNETLGQSFIITGFNIYYQPGGEQQYERA